MDFQLTEQEQALRDLARDFADRHIRPGLLEREKIADPDERMPWDIVDAASAAGLRTLTVPPEYGGPDPGPSLLARVLVIEELAAADPGFAHTIDHSLKDPAMIAALGTQQQKDWFFPPFMADPRYLTSTAASEPNHGADWSLPYEATHFDTMAVLDGDEWVINGEKTCISHGGVSKMMLVYACTDPTAPFSQGSTCFIVPRGPGVKRGALQEKLGYKLLNNMGIVFENCRIPKWLVLGELNGAMQARHVNRYENQVGLIANRTGCTRGAFEEALEYTKIRIQGGKPIIEHQAVALKLGEMYTLVESLRAMLYRLAWMAEHEEQADPKYGPMLTWYCAEACMRVATLAVQVTGCGGTWLSLFGQKHLRDAAMSFGGAGTHTIQLLKAVQGFQRGPVNSGAESIARMRKL